MTGWLVEIWSLDGDTIAEEICLEWWEVEDAVEDFSYTLSFDNTIMISVLDDIEIDEDERWTIT